MFNIDKYHKLEFKWQSKLKEVIINYNKQHKQGLITTSKYLENLHNLYNKDCKMHYYIIEWSKNNEIL